MLKHLEQSITNFNAIILSDYDKGVLSENLIAGIIKIAKSHDVYLAVDPQVRLFKHYKGADVMTPNEKEASRGMGLPFPDKESDIKNMGNKIKAELELKHLIITRSHKALALFANDKSPMYVPAVAREVYDVSGAGDTVVATFTAAIAAGASPLDASLLSTFASAVVVGKVGTASISKKELLESINHEHIKKLG